MSIVLGPPRVGPPRVGPPRVAVRGAEDDDNLLELTPAEMRQQLSDSLAAIAELPGFQIKSRRPRVTKGTRFGLLAAYKARDGLVGDRIVWQYGVVVDVVSETLNKVHAFLPYESTAGALPVVTLSTAKFTSTPESAPASEKSTEMWFAFTTSAPAPVAPDAMMAATFTPAAKRTPRTKKPADATPLTPQAGASGSAAAEDRAWVDPLLRASRILDGRTLSDASEFEPQSRDRRAPLPEESDEESEDPDDYSAWRSTPSRR